MFGSNKRTSVIQYVYARKEKTRFQINMFLNKRTSEIQYVCAQKKNEVLNQYVSQQKNF